MSEFSSIVEAIAYHARSSPDKTAIVIAETEQRYTYGDLFSYSKAFSKYLGEVGVKRDDGDGFGTRVVVRCMQSIEYVVAMFAVHLAGGVFVPVEKSIADKRIAAIMKEVDSTILIAAKPLSGCDITYIPISRAMLHKDASTDKATSFPSGEALSDILWTTGTTGKSKGVMLSYHNQYTACDNVRHYQEFWQDDVVIIPQPMNHADGIRRFGAAMLAGAETVICNGVVFAKNFVSILAKYKVTVLSLVPAYLSLLLDDSVRDLFREESSRLRVMAISGAATPKKQKDLLRQVLPNTRLFSGYGASEAGAICSIEFGKQDQLNCLGRPNKHSKVMFALEDGTVVDSACENNPATLVCQGKNVMMGYWKEPELTKSVLHNGQLFLADVGYCDRDGNIYLIGRKDDVIITGGNKVAPFEIEELVMALPSVKECACVPIPNELMGSIPKLFVVFHSGEHMERRDILAYLNQRLETFKVPKVIEEISALPRIGIGKINRRQLMKG